MHKIAHPSGKMERRTQNGSMKFAYIFRTFSRICFFLAESKWENEGSNKLGKITRSNKTHVRNLQANMVRILSVLIKVIFSLVFCESREDRFDNFEWLEWDIQGKSWIFRGENWSSTITVSIGSRSGQSKLRILGAANQILVKLPASFYCSR